VARGEWVCNSADLWRLSLSLVWVSCLVHSARPTGSSTVLFEVSAVLYGPIGSLVLTVVLVKDCVLSARAVLLHSPSTSSTDYLISSLGRP
jgi:hypothetical protein